MKAIRPAKSVDIKRAIKISNRKAELGRIWVHSVVSQEYKKLIRR